MKEEFGRAIRMIESIDPIVLFQLITEDPSLLSQSLDRSQEFFSQSLQVQFYAGDTLLHITASAHQAVVTQFLIENGAKINSVNRRKNTPLHSASTGSPNFSHWSPLKQSETIQILVQNGAEIEAENLEGMTPLLCATRSRCSQAMKTLLQSGADPYRRNKNGSNSFDLTKSAKGKSGSGSDAARKELQHIIRILDSEGRHRCQT